MPKVFPGIIAIGVFIILPPLVVAGSVSAKLWMLTPAAQTALPPVNPFLITGTTGRGMFATNCASCHDAPQVGKGVNIPPDLSFVGSKIKREWLIEFIHNPERPKLRWQSDNVRPTTPMPAFKMTKKQAELLADYLLERKNETLVPTAGIDWAQPAKPEEIAAGKKVFAEYQCLGCHVLRGEGKQIGPHLDGVASRLRSDFMYQWIKDPQKIVPGTAMPNKELWDEELSAVVRYLQTLKEGKK